MAERHAINNYLYNTKIIFWMPWLGMIIGAASGALVGKLSDVGVDDEFIKQVGSTIQPGNSALFLLVEKATPDKVMNDLKKFKNVKVLKTSLSQEKGINTVYDNKRVYAPVKIQSKMPYALF